MVGRWCKFQERDLCNLTVLLKRHRTSKRKEIVMPHHIHYIFNSKLFNKYRGEMLLSLRHSALRNVRL
jgi:hypothetical protein